MRLKLISILILLKITVSSAQPFLADYDRARVIDSLWVNYYFALNGKNIDSMLQDVAYLSAPNVFSDTNTFGKRINVNDTAYLENLILGDKTGLLKATNGIVTTVTDNSTLWDGFYNTPSTRITAGTNLSWDGNTLNASGGGTSIDTTRLAFIDKANEFTKGQTITGALYTMSATADTIYVPTFTYGTGSYESYAYQHAIRVYAYKLAPDGTKIFSVDYKQSAIYQDADNENYYKITWAWDAVDSADGYKLFKFYSDLLWTYDYYAYAEDTTFEDTSPSIWTAGTTALPSGGYYNSALVLHSGFITTGRKVHNIPSYIDVLDTADVRYNSAGYKLGGILGTGMEDWHFYVSGAIVGGIGYGYSSGPIIQLMGSDLGSTYKYSIWNKLSDSPNSIRLYHQTLANTRFVVGNTSTAPLGTVSLFSAAAAVKLLVLRGASSQSANMFEIQNSGGTVLDYINSTGSMFVEQTKRVACGGGSTGSTTTANGTVTLEINGTSYYLLKAGAP